MGKLVRNLSTHEHREWWNAVKKAAKGVPVLSIREQDIPTQLRDYANEIEEEGWEEDRIALLRESATALTTAQARIAELEERCKPWLDYLDDVVADSGVTAENVAERETAMWRRRVLDRDQKIAALEADRAQLEGQLEAAIALLANWCADIARNGSGWDDWDENYKDARYRPGPLRELLDAAIDAAMKPERD